MNKNKIEGKNIFIFRFFFSETLNLYIIQPNFIDFFIENFVHDYIKRIYGEESFSVNEDVNKNKEKFANKIINLFMNISTNNIIFNRSLMFFISNKDEFQRIIDKLRTTSKSKLIYFDSNYSYYNINLDNNWKFFIFLLSYFNSVYKKSSKKIEDFLNQFKIKKIYLEETGKYLGEEDKNLVEELKKLNDYYNNQKINSDMISLSLNIDYREDLKDFFDQEKKMLIKHFPSMFFDFSMDVVLKNNDEKNYLFNKIFISFYEEKDFKNSVIECFEGSGLNYWIYEPKKEKMPFIILFQEEKSFEDFFSLLLVKNNQVITDFKKEELYFFDDSYYYLYFFNDFSPIKKL